MKETNIEAIKKVAMSFLLLDPEINEQFPFIVNHPFITNNPFPIPNKGKSCDLVDVSLQENRARIIRYLTSIVLDCHTTVEIMLLVAKGYRRVFFKYINTYLSKQDYASLLRDVWICTEMHSQDVNVSLRTMSSWFKKAKQEWLMTNKEKSIVESFPDEITIYRGASEAIYHPAMSWTTSLDVAKYFATRFGKRGAIFKATVKKENVLAYFNQEQEVVVDYKKVVPSLFIKKATVL